jgi:exodeoxyribonuclease-3
MRFATWNVNSVLARLPRLLGWLSAARPDVCCLQELKCSAAEFPTEAVGGLGYEVAAHASGRWNGVAILSRVGLDDVRRGLADEPGFPPEGSMLAATTWPMPTRLWPTR